MKLMSVKEAKAEIDIETDRKKAELEQIIKKIKSALMIFEEAKDRSMKQLDKMEQEKLRLQAEITTLTNSIEKYG
jgi:hypothetical protein